jgi:hypothetical protein
MSNTWREVGIDAIRGLNLPQWGAGLSAGRILTGFAPRLRFGWVQTARGGLLADKAKEIQEMLEIL